MDIAKKLRPSESTIRKRVQALKENGVIKRFTVEIDPAKMRTRGATLVRK
jgi:DNA-binding Lrp family transcriptional regulator